MYRIEVDAPGFRKKLIDNVKVDTATISTEDIRLETGSLASEVTIQADAVTVNTESGGLGSTITAR
jgi:hypothetical protein